MATADNVSLAHFDGHGNLTQAQKRESGPTLAEWCRKVYVDITAVEAYIAGLKDPKDSVRLATAGALNACTAAGTGAGKTLTQNAAAVENIDGQAVVVGDRVLVKNQVAAKDNGIYVVTTVGTVAVKQVLTRATDADSDDEVTPGMFTHVEEGTANANTKWFLTTTGAITLDTTALTFAELIPVDHATLHERAGADEIDGDHLDIDFTPTGYAPSTTPAEAANVDDLAAHLAGVSDELDDAAHTEGSPALAVLIQAGQPVATDTLAIGAETMEADGAGALDFAIAGGAEATMDNLIAAFNGNTAQNLKMIKLSATQVGLYSADAPDGNVLGANPNIALDASGLTNYTWHCGDVNMNTLSGVAPGARRVESVAVTVTAAMITATLARVAFPFTPRVFHAQVFTAAGVLRLTQNDTFAIAGDDILVVLNGGGAPDIQATDVIHITAIE